MPLDASIPLSYKPPQIENPINVYGQMLSLKGMAQAQQAQADNAPLVFQANQAKAQEATIAAQQAAEDQKQQKITADTFTAANGDPVKWRAAAIAAGANPQSIALMDQHHAQLKLTNANLSVAENKLEVDRNTRLATKMYAYSQKSPVEKDKQWKNFSDGLTSSGDMKPDEIEQLQKQYPTYPGDQEFQSLMDLHSNTLAIQKQQNANLTAQLNATAKTSAINRANTQTAREQKADLVGPLMQSKTLDQWNQTLLNSGLPMDTFGDPPFDPETGKVDPAAMARVNQSAMTPAQRQADGRAQQTEADRKISQANAAARLKLAQDKAAKDTAAERRNADLALAYKALNESNDQGGKTPKDPSGIDSAIRNVADPDNYGAGHPIGVNRGGVLRALDALKKSGMTEQQMQNRLNKDAETQKMLREFGLGEPDTAPPATPATTKPKAAAPATQRTEAQIRQGAVSRGFDANGPEAEAAIKAARTKGQLQ